MPKSIPMRHRSFQEYGRSHRPVPRSNPFCADIRKHLTCHWVCFIWRWVATQYLSSFLGAQAVILSNGGSFLSEAQHHWRIEGDHRGAGLRIIRSRDAEAVGFSAASTASTSALPLPLPQKCSYFISSYPTHKCRSGRPSHLLPLPLSLPHPWL